MGITANDLNQSTIMYKVIRTDRLLIRPIHTEDKEFVYSLMNSEGWLKFIGDRNIRNVGDAEKYIQKVVENEKYFWSVFEIAETKQPIGILTFLHRDSLPFPDFGFAILPAFEKKGYTWEASQKYMSEIISQKKHEKILGITIPENENSIRLLTKLGLEFQYHFDKDGELLSLYSRTIHVTPSPLSLQSL